MSSASSEALSEAIGHIGILRIELELACNWGLRGGSLEMQIA